MGNENYTASSWIITEAAIANALNREVIFLVEEGIDVDQFSCINGNLQYIEFNRNNFAYRCTEVVKAIEARRVQLFTAKINE
jgi:hypothetical protein